MREPTGSGGFDIVFNNRFKHLFFTLCNHALPPPAFLLVSTLAFRVLTRMYNVTCHRIFVKGYFDFVYKCGNIILNSVYKPRLLLRKVHISCNYTL